MENLVVEYRGVLRPVTAEQLFILVRRGFISPDASVLADGESVPAREILAQLGEASPDARGYVTASRPFESAAALPIPTAPGGAVASAPVQDATYSLALDGRGAAPPDERQPLRVKLVAAGCLAALAIALVVAVCVARTPKREQVSEVERYANPTWKEGERPETEPTPEPTVATAAPEADEPESDVPEAQTPEEPDEDAAPTMGVATTMGGIPTMGLSTTTEDAPATSGNAQNVFESDDEESEPAPVAEEPASDATPSEPPQRAYAFDDTVDRISANFADLDLDSFRISVAAEWSALDKDEYETIAEYRARRRALLAELPSRRVWEDATFSDKFAVILTGEKTRVTQEYDAEKNRVYWYLPGAAYAKTERRGSCRINTSSYKARLVAVDGVSLRVPNDHELTESGLYFTHRCSREEASDIYGNVGALAVFTLDRSVLAKFESHKQYNAIDITFGRGLVDPRFYVCDTMSSYYARVLNADVYVKGLQVWFYDMRSGEVLEKCALAKAPEMAKENKKDSEESEN